MPHAFTTATKSRASTATRASTSGAPGASEELASTLQGYRVFPMDGCSFMIKETPDQKLVLADVFVTDDLTGQPKQLSTAPPAALDCPTSFHEIEWAAEYPGNDLEDKPAVRWVLKTYLIAEQTDEEGTGLLDFDKVALLDAASQSISFPSVTRLAPENTPEELLELRIRENGLVIDTVESLPDAESVVRSKLAGVPAASRLETELLGGDVGQQAIEQSALDAQDDDDDDIDVDIRLEDDSEDLDDFMDGGDEMDSDEEFDGDEELEDDGDDFD